MTAPHSSPIPSWLETPPRVPSMLPPVDTRRQVLPFQSLAWEDFERLCLRLVRLEADVTHCQIYGEPGQAQEGIDIYARLAHATPYRVYQCKRVQSFTARRIEQAVTTFLQHEWANQSDTFVLCTTDSLKETRRARAVEAQAQVLQQQGIALVIWDRDQLSMRLKELPELVDDFFGRPWVTAFCGEDQGAALGHRLDATQVHQYRVAMATFYHRVFSQHDPGLPGSGQITLTPLALAERYVLPDVTERRSRMVIPSPPPAEMPSVYARHYPAIAGTDRDPSPHFQPTRPIVAPVLRQACEPWFVRSDRHVILGGPGAGKSTLLRFITLDLLQDTPQLSGLARKWGRFLPVWVPFAFWTKMIRQNETTSLRDTLEEWFHQWDEDRLWPLVAQALDDERLLLLVDGLDEWTTITTANLAIQRLQVFVDQRQLPALLTARPHGFAQLTMMESGWQIGALSDFSTAQQTQLTQCWFTHWLNHTTAQPGPADTTIPQQAQTATEAFITELRHSPDLHELAKIPLLLCLLIYFRLQQLQLPHNRFDAYALVIDHLIITHPQRRQMAASQLNDPIDLSDQEIKRVFAYLAFHIQLHAQDGLLAEESAFQVLEQYLMDQDAGFGLARSDARPLSRVLLTTGEERIGLLVRAAPHQLRFFHRSIQEYLAADYLSRRSFDDQLQHVVEQCIQPHWREVLLGVFSLTKRAEELQRFADRILERRTTMVECYNVNMLLAELAFGPFECSSRLIRQLAERIFGEIEQAAWMPYREHLVRSVLTGLHATKARELVKAKLQTWFPQRIPWRSSVYEAMVHWPPLPAVINSLIQGLYAEAAQDQRAAAKALAQLAASDSTIGDRVAYLARTSIDPMTRAAALLCLLEGWPDHQDLTQLLAHAIVTPSPELQLVAITGFVQREQQTDDQRLLLLTLTTWAGGLNSTWRRDVVPLLLRGWPQHPDTKARCFQAINQPNQRANMMDGDWAVQLLLEGYPQDDDVAAYCVHQITTESLPFRMSPPAGWYELYRHFRDHPALVAAIDTWLPQQTNGLLNELTFAALVGRTAVAKETLLRLLDTARQDSPGEAQWPAWALLEHWGMGDAQVAAVLLELIHGPDSQVVWIAHLLPAIMQDDTACRNRLLHLLHTSEPIRYERITAAFRRLPSDVPDPTLVEALLACDLDPTNEMDQEVITYLIAYHSYDERVREVALRQLHQREGPYHAIARGYAHDPQIREMLLARLQPLPAHLRTLIAAHLGDTRVETTFARDLLAWYDHDPDVVTKTQAAIGYHRQLLATNSDCTAALATLSQNMVATGFFFADRRQAALAGLIVLNRADIIQEIHENYRHPPRWLYSFPAQLQANIPLIRLILQHWERLTASLGADFLRNYIFYEDTSVGSMYDVFAILADEYAIPRQRMLDALESESTEELHPNILRFVSRVSPTSPVLLEHCLRTIHSGTGYRWSEKALVAADILATYYASDQELAKRILPDDPEQQGPISEGQALAVCMGWADTPVSKRVAAWFEEQPVSYILHAALLGLHGTNTQLDAFIDELFRLGREIPTHYHAWLMQPIVRRLHRDDDIYRHVETQLHETTDPSRKVTLLQLLTLARGLTPTLHTWCTREIAYQCHDSYMHEVGIDLLSGTIQPVIHSILEVLNNPKAH